MDVLPELKVARPSTIKSPWMVAYEEAKSLLLILLLICLKGTISLSLWLVVGRASDALLTNCSAWLIVMAKESRSESLSWSWWGLFGPS